MKGDARQVRTLLYQGADVNALEVEVTPRPGKESTGITALMEAALYGRALVARLLLARGADANRVNYLHITALERAVAAGHLDCVRLLFERTTRPHARQDSLVAAAIFHRLSCLNYLLNNGVPVESQSSISGYTALVAAAENGEMDCVKLLIQRGANVNTPDAHGYTPLMMAAYERRLPVVQFLLAHGAEVSSKDKESRSVLTWAHTRGGSRGSVQEEESITRLLHQAGANE